MMDSGSDGASFLDLFEDNNNNGNGAQDDDGAGASLLDLFGGPGEPDVDNVDNVDNANDVLKQFEKRGRGRPRQPRGPAPCPEISTKKVSKRKRKSHQPQQPQPAHRTLEQLQDMREALREKRLSADREGAQIQSQNENESSWLAEVAACFFTSDDLRQQTVAVAGRFGISEYLVRQTERRLAFAALKAHERICRSVLQRLLDQAEAAASSSSTLAAAQPQCRPHLYLRIRQYDETPAKLRAQCKVSKEPRQFCSQRLPRPKSDVGDGDTLLSVLNAVGAEIDVDTLEPENVATEAKEGDKVKVCDAQIVKLFVTERRFAAMFVSQSERTGCPESGPLDGSEDSFSSFHYEFQSPGCLQVIQSNSGELMAAALYVSGKKSFDAVAIEMLGQINRTDCQLVTPSQQANCVVSLTL